MAQSIKLVISGSMSFDIYSSGIVIAVIAFSNITVHMIKFNFVKFGDLGVFNRPFLLRSDNGVCGSSNIL